MNEDFEFEIIDLNKCVANIPVGNKMLDGVFVTSAGFSCLRDSG